MNDLNKIIPNAVITAINKLKTKNLDAYPVGGCIRDSLMGKSPKDWDLCCSGTPEEMINALEGETIIPTGIKHGTITLLLDIPIEITTFRKDGEYGDHRRPSYIEFSTSLEEDLSRRDFTINAMAWDIYENKIIDPFGGIMDLEKGIIRCVGNCNKRFNEDALRILRCLRFASILNFAIEEETKRALINNKELLREIAVERSRVEIENLLLGDNCSYVLRNFWQVLNVVIPEIEPMVGFEQKNNHHIYDVWEHTIRVVEAAPKSAVLRWTALFHDIGKPRVFSLDEEGVGHFYHHAHVSCNLAQEIMNRLKFDTETKKSVLKLIKYHDSPVPPDRKIIKRYFNKMGEEDFFRLVDLARADNMGQNPEFRDRQANFDRVWATAEDIIKENQCFSLKDLTLKGGDLVAEGYEGKEIGEALNESLEMVLDEKIENNKEKLLTYLKKVGKYKQVIR